MGSLIDEAAIKWLFKMWWSILTPAAGTLTRGRSSFSIEETEVETPRSWAVCLITMSQYLKMRWTQQDTHTDASAACSRITSRNRRHEPEIVGPCYEGRCRCQSCWNRSMFWTQRWSLRLEKFCINALHIVVDQGLKRKILDYLSWRERMPNNYIS